MHDNIQHVEKVDYKNLILPHKKFQQQTTNDEKDIKKVMMYIYYIYKSLRDVLLWIWGTYYDLILK
jgi:hypothetical protein